MAETADIFDLSGKVAIVTGGSRGLGLQMAEAMISKGCHVVLTARKQTELDEAAAHLQSSGGSVSTLACDLQAPDTAQLIVDKTLDAHGKIDILINNAGTSWAAPMQDHPLDAWNKVMALNVTAPFLADARSGTPGDDPGEVRQDSEHRLHRRPGGQPPRSRHVHHRLQYVESGDDQFHPCACHRVGPLRHQRERTLPRLFFLQNVGRTT